MTVGGGVGRGGRKGEEGGEGRATEVREALPQVCQKRPISVKRVLKPSPSTAAGEGRAKQVRESESAREKGKERERRCRIKCRGGGSVTDTRSLVTLILGDHLLPRPPRTSCVFCCSVSSVGVCVSANVFRMCCECVATYTAAVTARKRNMCC